MTLHNHMYPDRRPLSAVASDPLAPAGVHRSRVPAITMAAGLASCSGSSRGFVVVGDDVGGGWGADELAGQELAAASASFGFRRICASSATSFGIDP